MPKAKWILSREEEETEPPKCVSDFTEAQRNHYQSIKTPNPTPGSVAALTTKPVWTKTLSIKATSFLYHCSSSLSIANLRRLYWAGKLTPGQIKQNNSIIHQPYSYAVRIKRKRTPKKGFVIKFDFIRHQNTFSLKIFFQQTQMMCQECDVSQHHWLGLLQVLLSILCVIKYSFIFFILVY